MDQPIILNFIPIPLFIGVSILVALLIIFTRQGRRPLYLVSFAVFWLYVMAVVALTIFPIPVDGQTVTMITKQRILFTFSQMNLIPFQYLDFFNGYVIFLEVIRNILLTMPFGFGISFVVKVRPKVVLLLAMAVGFLIETSQLIISLLIAGPYRTVDITDIFLNAIGVLLGYGFYRVIVWLYQQLLNRSGTEDRVLTS